MTPIAMTPSTMTRITMMPDQRPFAQGLYITQFRKTVFFKRLLADRSNTPITIGSDSSCDIVILDCGLESIHAELAIRHNALYLHRRSRAYDIFVDGWQLMKPVPILTSMVIDMADARFVGTNHKGGFEISAATISEFCRKAADACGSHRAAGKRLGRSHNFIRKQFEPRETRYKPREK